MINLVTIDPSINSTGLTVNGNIFSIASEGISLTKKGELVKWFQLSEECATITTVDTTYGNEKLYSKLEVVKLETYQKIANIVRTIVDNHTNPKYNTLVLIEGYSYSSLGGPLIDLVTLSTLIRRNLFSRSKTELVVFSPSTLKRLAGWIAYPEIVKGKKVEYRNNQGVASGKFNKREIYKALTENNKIQTEWIKLLRAHEDEIFKAKSIPKPIEDINDAVTLLHIGVRAMEEQKDFKKTVDYLRSL